MQYQNKTHHFGSLVLIYDIPMRYTKVLFNLNEN